MAARPTNRFIGRFLPAGAAVVVVGLGAWALTSDLTDGAAWAGVAGLLCAFAQAALSAASYLRRSEASWHDAGGLADNLAQIVQAEWLGEVAARHLRDPKVLPLCWTSTRGELDDRPGRVVRDRLAGRMDGRFDDVIVHLADGYRQIPSGRLVVLGEPGAGKTVLAMLLTLGLLKARAGGASVPVLLAASSWDPVCEGLDEWVVHTLADSYYAGRSEIPRRLLEHGLLVPVLDGLDEIPESARRGAVRALNYAIGADHPVVVTCRTAEYAEVITDGAPTLHRAPVVEILPVPAGEAVGYLSQVDWPDGTVWEGVYADLRAHPHGPVAAALSTPLMLALARMVYQRLGGDPAELLDATRFDCRHAVEDRLTDRVIDAAYAPDRLPSGNPVNPATPRWTAQQARPWLTFLAVYLHRHRERDLAWWRLSQRLLSPWAGPVIGIGGGIAIMVAVSAWIAAASTGATTYDSLQPAEVLDFGALVGGSFTILAIVIWYAGAGRAPGRLSFAIRGSLGRLRRGFVTGTALIAVPAVPVLLVAAVLIQVDNEWSFSDIQTYIEALAGVIAVAGVVAVALAVHNWLDAPPAGAAQASPEGFLRQDRRSSWVAALAGGATVGVLAAPALTAAVILGGLSSQWLTGWPGWPGNPDASAIVSTRWWTLSDVDVPVTTPDASGKLMIIGAACLAPALIFALLALLTRAWPRFTLTRVLLAGQGRLPLRLLGFLADARDRQLLRQSGGAYQFRHVRLQERLADQSTPNADIHGRPTPVTPGSDRRRYRRPILAATAAAVALTATIVGVSHLPRDTARATLTDRPGIVTGVAFSPNGQTVATADADGTARLWNTATGHPIREPFTGGGGDGSYVVFSPDGLTLAVGGGVTASLWNIATGRPIATLTGYWAFNPHGPTAASAADDGAVRLWNTGTGALIMTLTGHLDQVDRVGFSPDGHTLAVGDSAPGHDTVRLWNVATGRLVATLTRSLTTPPSDEENLGHDLEFSADGRTVTTLSNDGTVRLWGTATGALITTLNDRTAEVSSKVLGPGGQTVAIIGADRAVHIWNIAGGQRVTDLAYANNWFVNSGGNNPADGHRSSSDVAFGPDGRTIAADQDCGGFGLWNAATGRPIITLQPDNCRTEFVGAWFRPDGRIVAIAGDNGTARLWNAATGSPIGEPLTGHTASLTTVVFSSDGQTVATASTDGTARLWDIPTR